MLACKRLAVTVTAMAIMIFQLGCHKQFSITAPPTPRVVDRSKYSLDDYKEDLKMYNDNLKDPAAAKQVRDKIVYSFMAEIDDAYGQFTKNLYTGKGAFGVTAGHWYYHSATRRYS